MKLTAAHLTYACLVLAVPSFAEVVTCSDLDGAAVYSTELTPTYLGFFGSQFAQDSIENEFGPYGDQFSSLSVRNLLGDYGTPGAPYSATNDFTDTPPVVYSGYAPIALLTSNAHLAGAVSLHDIDASCTFYASSPIGGGQTAPPVNQNQHGVTGTWRNPAAPGQGIVLEVAPDLNGSGIGLLFGGWFTYDLSEPSAQRWYSLQGDVNAGQPASAFSIFQSTGGAFYSSQQPAINAVGQAQLVLLDCNDALLHYSFSDGSARSGVMPLTRLLQNVTCGAAGDNGAPTGSYALSGTWADSAAAKGQGLLIEINPIQGILFAGWFTYARNSPPGAGPAGQRWYSLQAGLGTNPASITGIGIFETTGGAFNLADPSSTVQIGSAELQFSSCSAATLTFTFTSGENAGQNGVLHLSRVVPAPSGCH